MSQPGIKCGADQVKRVRAFQCMMKLGEFTTNPSAGTGEFCFPEVGCQ
jgi:hypothetical protein